MDDDILLSLGNSINFSGDTLTDIIQQPVTLLLFILTNMVDPESWPDSYQVQRGMIHAMLFFLLAILLIPNKEEKQALFPVIGTMNFE